MDEVNSDYLTEEEMDDLLTYNSTLDAIADVLDNSEPNPQALRMGNAVLRRIADTLDRVADRWESR